MPANLVQLLHVRSQLTEGVLVYLDAVQSLPDSTPPSYFAGRRLTALYVPPEVMVQPPRQKGEEGKRKQGKRPGPLMADDDAGLFEDAAQDATQQPPRRVTWAEELPKLRHAVLLGRPGEGKTLLAQMSARQLAAEEYAALQGYHKSVDEVVLPVYLRSGRYSGGSDPEDR